MIHTFTNLDSTWVKHDSYLLAIRLGWKVLTKLCSYTAYRAVRPGNLAPDDSVLGASLVGLVGLVYIRDSLAQVERDLLLRVDALDLEESSVLVCVPKASLVAREDGIHVQSDWLAPGGPLRLAILLPPWKGGSLVTSVVLTVSAWHSI